MLVINAGSSSLKFAIYRQETMQRDYSGSVKNIGEASGGMEIIDKNGKSILLKAKHYVNMEDAAVATILWLKTITTHCKISAIGYRLVQGGADHRYPELITEKLLSDLAELIFLAPNHLPDELVLIRQFQSEFRNIPHIACFDTYFHKDMPDQAKYYALPEKYKNQGLMRYGFHGLSYEYIMHQLNLETTANHPQKIIIAHLGNGSSMSAVSSGKGKDTTMGISPIGGLVMGTRCGDLDPGAILFILKKSGMTVEQLDALLSHESGMKAIAGTGDMKALVNSATEDSRAKAAVNLFCYQAKKYIGALAAALGGLDVLVFTGGVGENSPEIRSRICLDMDFMGLKLDTELNQQAESIISCADSRVGIRIINTDEEYMIAIHTKNTARSTSNK